MVDMARRPLYFKVLQHSARFPVSPAIRVSRAFLRGGAFLRGRFDLGNVRINVVRNLVTMGRILRFLKIYYSKTLQYGEFWRHK